MTETYGVIITVVLAIRITNVIVEEAVNLITTLPLMVKTVGNKKSSLLIVTPMAATQSFAVAVQGKIIPMNVTTSRTPHHLGSGLLSWSVICRYRSKEGFQSFVNSGSLKHFIGPELVRGIE